jgi:hypothetical protein
MVELMTDPILPQITFLFGWHLISPSKSLNSITISFVISRECMESSNKGSEEAGNIQDTFSRIGRFLRDFIRFISKLRRYP